MLMNRGFPPPDTNSRWNVSAGPPGDLSLDCEHTTLILTLAVKVGQNSGAPVCSVWARSGECPRITKEGLCPGVWAWDRQLLRISMFLSSAILPAWFAGHHPLEMSKLSKVVVALNPCHQALLQDYPSLVQLVASLAAHRFSRLGHDVRSARGHAELEEIIYMVAVQLETLRQGNPNLTLCVILIPTAERKCMLAHCEQRRRRGRGKMQLRVRFKAACMAGRTVPLPPQPLKIPYGRGARRYTAHQLQYEQELSTQHLQAGIKGRQARRHASDGLDELDEWSVRSLQGGVRGKHARQEMNMMLHDGAAQSLQGGIKGNRSRRDVRELHNSMHHDSATGVQAGIRAHSVRRDLHHTRYI